MNACIFCKIIAGEAPARILKTWEDAIAIAPLNPVVAGHVLIIPREHVADALENPLVTAAAMRRAAEFATGPCNLITSVGKEATQSVFHLHIHIVPRAPGDGLLLPWSNSAA
jgi:histidine triad (HIT) family protein